jgi:hypothetical protein
VRFREIIGEICDPAAAAKDAQRRRDREAKARRDIAAAATTRADASHRYQQSLAKANDSIARAQRTLT